MPFIVSLNALPLKSKLNPAAPPRDGNISFNKLGTFLTNINVAIIITQVTYTL